MNATIREAGTPEERARAGYLFRHEPVPAGSLVLVAARTSPVERFVETLAMWGAEPGAVRFQLAWQPGVSMEDFAADLVREAADRARQAGASILRCHTLLERGAPLFTVLECKGLRTEQTVRYFEVPAPETRRRVDEAFARMGNRIPAAWRTAPLRGCDPAEIFALVSEYALMASDEFRRHFSGPGAFDPDLSVVLLDGSKAIGCLLANVVGDTISVPIRVVALPVGGLRALGNLALLSGISRHGSTHTSFRRLVFRGGEIEHRETANLMRRMGGVELPPRHSLILALNR